MDRWRSLTVRCVSKRRLTGIRSVNTDVSFVIYLKSNCESECSQQVAQRQQSGCLSPSCHADIKKKLLQDALGGMCYTLAAVDDKRPKRPMYRAQLQPLKARFATKWFRRIGYMLKCEPLIFLRTLLPRYANNCCSSI